MPKAQRVLLWALTGLALVFACTMLVAYLHPNHNTVSFVVSQSSAASRASEAMSITRLTGSINVNTAGQEELCELPAVGVKTAQSIIAEREQNGRFFYPEDLLNVKGIGEKTLQKLLPQICLK